MQKPVATLKRKSLASAAAMSHKGKCAPCTKTTTGKHDCQIQSQVPMVSAVAVFQEGQLVSLAAVSPEALPWPWPMKVSWSPHRRDLAVARRTPLFCPRLRPPVGKEAFERHNEMINADRDALQEILGVNSWKPF